MKRIIKRIIILLLFLAVFTGAFAGSFLLFRDNSTGIDSKYLAVVEERDGEYYLQKAAKDIVFYIDRADKAAYTTLFELSDMEGNLLTPSVKRVNKEQFKILPPKEGYEPGATYTVSLKDGAVFSSEELAKVRTLVFSIGREAIEQYSYTDLVQDHSDETLREVSDSVIELPGGKLSAGDIIIGKDDEGNLVSYKITELLDNNQASVAQPALEEIYQELELYGEYTWSVEDITANPELEVEITENVKKSSFYASLISTAYAADEKKDGTIKVNIKPDTKEQSLIIEVTITLKPGENGLFGIQELQKQKITLKLEEHIDLTARCNIKGITNWDVAAIVSSGFSWSIELAPYTDEWEKETELRDLYAGTKPEDRLAYQKNIEKVVKALDKVAADATAGEIKLFTWNLPIPSVPGMYIGADVKLFANFEMAANLTIAQNCDTVYTSGISFINGEFNSYSNSYRQDDGIEFSLRGKAEFKAGVKLIVRASLLNVAEISVDPQVGLYAEAYITFPINAREEAVKENFLYSYFEPGLYFSADITAELRLLIKNFDYQKQLVEKKFPIKELTLGNDKIACNITSNIRTIRAVDNKINVPDIIFEYYDVKAGCMDAEVLETEDIKFTTSDNTVLKVEDGKLVLPTVTASSNLFVTATYLHTDGMTYSTVIRVLISGSILEGKVSAYSSDQSANALNGATVQLFSVLNSTTPISTAITEADGRFAFNVSKGDYRLVISADGYKTLTSTQSVAEDEIKYTEHILLIDSSQTGSGSASGTVTNALDGNGVGGAKIKLRNDWNNYTDAYTAGFATETDEYGHYIVSGVPAGYYTVEAAMDNYVTGYANIIVLSDNPKNDYDFTITPVLSEDEIRIVLTWGAEPSDIDSHLIGRTPSGDSFNVYYDDKVYHYNDAEMANLDVDDTTSYGPETITILEDIFGTYTYAVHDYSNRDASGSYALSNSGAIVRVYQGSTRIAEYHVPVDQIGTYWTVFQIDRSGNITPVNAISNTKPSP
jgi:hypothetical protein